MLKSLVKFSVFILVVWIALLFTAPLWPLNPLVGWVMYNMGMSIAQVALYMVPVGFVLSGIVSWVLNKQYNMFDRWVIWDKEEGARWAKVLNWVFETKQYKFGNKANTVSAILGANLHNRQARWWDWLFTHIADRGPLKNDSTHCYDSYKIELKRKYGVFNDV